MTLTLTNRDVTMILNALAFYEARRRDDKNHPDHGLINGYIADLARETRKEIHRQLQEQES